MNFQQAINDYQLDEAKKITIDSFLKKIAEYSTLDQAFTDLPSEYIEFYAKNEKKLQKALDNLFEGYNPEAQGYLGMAATQEKTIKKIKYKGEIFTLVFDPEIGSWQAIPAFRSITQALRYGKSLVDNI